MKAGRLIIGLLIAPLLVVAAFAQEQPKPVAPPERATARATIRTFLGAFYEANAQNSREPIQQAVACLDLSPVPRQYRTLRGLELAINLKNILDRIEYIEIERVPNQPDGPPWVFHRDSSGEVVIARQENGEWLFTAQTVRSIPALLNELEDLPTVEGVIAAPQTLTPGSWLRSKMPASLRQKGILIEHWQWLGLLAALLLSWGVAHATAQVLRLTVGRLIRGQWPGVDDTSLKRSLQPVKLLLIVGVMGICINLLSLQARVWWGIYLILKLAMVIGLFLLAYRLVDVVTAILKQKSTREDSSFDRLLVPFTGAMLRIAVVVIALALIAENFGLKISGLIAGLGIGGIAIALAAQDTLSNFFGSLALMVERPFRAGDLIRTGEIEGTVKEVGLRSTRVRTPEDAVVIVPNSTLAKASITNVDLRRYRRWRTLISLTYDTPPEKIEAFCAGVRDLIRGRQFLRQDEFHVYLQDFAPSSLDVLLIVFFEAPDYATELQARHTLALDIIGLAQQVGARFAFPTQTVHLASMTGERGEEETRAVQQLSLARDGQG